MSYSVQLEIFAGPLDLLLFLIRKEEVEIHEVEIAKICDQYLAYVNFMRRLDLDLSADFLVMASTMMAIKARALVPGDPVDLDEELDPEDDLIQQLLEYKKYKMLARELQERALERQRRFVVNRKESDVGDVPLQEVGVFDLVEAFAKIVKEAGLDKPEVVIKPERPIREYVRDLTTLLQESEVLEFSKIFSKSQDRSDVIGMFCALLEIMKLGVVQAFQTEVFGEIEIRLVGDPQLALSLSDRDFDSLGSDSDEETEESADDPSPERNAVSEDPAAVSRPAPGEVSPEDDTPQEIAPTQGPSDVPEDSSSLHPVAHGRKIASRRSRGGIGGRAEKDGGAEALEAG